MDILNRQHIEIALQNHPLTGALKKQTDKLLDLLDPTGHATVADIHQSLFPEALLGSANTMLNRLISNLNDHFEDAGLPIKAHASANRKAGANQRQVWFTGTITLPADFNTPELNTVPEPQRLDLHGQLPHQQPARILIITFNKHESQAVHTHFGPPIKIINTNKYVVQQFSSTTQSEIYHVVSQQGNLRTQRTLHAVLEELKPDTVYATGICFGMHPEKQHIGDVLIASQVAEYENARISKSRTEPRGPNVEPTPHLIQTAQTLEHNPPTRLPTIHVGPLVSGEKLIDNAAFLKSLRRKYPQAIGGDMEAFGTYLATQEARCNWMVIKAICDFADGNKNENKEHHQQMAARNAVIVLAHLLALQHPNDPRLKTLPVLQPGFDTQDLNKVPKNQQLENYGQLKIMRGHKQLHKIKNESTWHSTKYSSEYLFPDSTFPGIKDVQTLVSDSIYYFRGTAPRYQYRLPTLPVHQTLMKWASSPAAPPLFALLGEYGMGKTLSAQRFARALQQQHEKDPSSRIPLLFDLRLLSGLHEKLPTLQEILEECMQRGWKRQANHAPYSFKMVQDWIRQGAVVILDGLDEALVKLTGSDGQIFSRELLTLVTDHLDEMRKAHQLDESEASDPRHIPRVLITCRTHYFRNLTDQNSHLSGQDRLHLEDDYEVLELLPLTEPQIQQYLTALFGPRAGDMQKTIQQLGNVMDFCKRPYTLHLLGGVFPELTHLKAQGAVVQTIGLYQMVVQSWLDRDDSKHHIRKNDKIRLAGFLAHHMWKTGSGILPISVLEATFHQWTAAQAELTSRYQKMNVDRLEEDLRTSTFLVRQDEDGVTVGFRFAHTSLQEYFLALHLLEALKSGNIMDLTIHVPSQETLSFLKEMLHTLNPDEENAIRHTLRNIRTQYQPKISEFVFHLGLYLHQQQGFALPLTGMDLTGAHLPDIQLHSADNTPVLNLRGVNFTGANLQDSLWEQVNFDGATFDGCNLERSIFVHCSLKQASFQRVNLTGVTFRHPNLKDSVFHGVSEHRLHFVKPLDAPAHLPGLTLPLNGNLPRKVGLSTGPTARIVALDWSRDGKLLAMGDLNGEVIVQDPSTGEILMRFTQDEPVDDLKFSPDSQHLAIAGGEGTIQVLYLPTRQCVQVHAIRIGGCRLLWHPDGKHVTLTDHLGQLTELDVFTGKTVDVGDTLTQHPLDRAAYCKHSQDGQHLLVWIAPQLHLFSSCTHQPLKTFKPTVALSQIEVTHDLQELYGITEHGVVHLDLHANEILAQTRLNLRSPKHLKLSPDGKALLVLDADGQFFVLDAQTLEATHRRDFSSYLISNVIWSPDSSQLAFAGANVIWLFQPLTLQQRTLTDSTEPEPDVHWNPTSTHIALLSAMGDDTPFSLAVLDTQGQLLYRFLGVGAPAVDWSPNGQAVACKSNSHTLQWLNLDAEVKTLEFNAPSNITKLQWSPDSNFFTCIAQDHNGVFVVHRLSGEVWECSTQRVPLDLWWAANTLWCLVEDQVLAIDLASQHITCTFKTPVGTRSFYPGPDGNQALLVGFLKEIHLLDAARQTVQPLELEVENAHWLPDGNLGMLTAQEGGRRRLASGEIQVLNATETNDLTNLIYESEHDMFIDTPLPSVMPSPDKKHQVIMERSGVVRIQPEHTAAKQHHVLFNFYGYARWNSDGQLLSVEGDVSDFLHWEVQQQGGRIETLPWEAFDH